MKERLYHIVAINERTGAKVYCTRYPTNHKDSCVMLSKFTPHKGIRCQLEEVRETKHEN